MGISDLWPNTLLFIENYSFSLFLLFNCACINKQTKLHKDEISYL